MGGNKGKTILSSAIQLYGLLGGICPAPFIASASTSRKNASQVYRELANSIRKNPKLKSICKCLDSTKEIIVKSIGGRYSAFSCDAASNEGENLSLCLIDELHAHVSEKLYRSLEYSTIARKGFLINISTAGSDASTNWFNIFQYAKGVQDGSIIDTSLFPYICTTPDNADIEDPAVWRLSNPSLGISFSEDDFRRDFERAKQAGQADLTSFKILRLNMFCAAADSYIDPIKYDRCQGSVSEDVLRDAPAFVAVDLSQTVDPCSVGICHVLPDNTFHIQNHSWVCEQGVRNREAGNLPKYRTWAEQGYMTITRGSVNDYPAIHRYISDLRNKYRNVREVIFDAYNAIEMAAQLQGEGFMVFRQPQNHKYYTAPMKGFEVAINEKRIIHDGNKMLRWALSNTQMDVDSYGNCKPSREKSTDKIDPCVVTLMSYARAMEFGAIANRTSVYETRGPMVFSI